jgi:hypothetical protein
VSGRVTVTDGGSADLLRRVRALAGGRSVRVGVLADESKRKDKPVKGSTSKKARVLRKLAKRTPYTLLQVAIVHEFGGGHVPARSFIRATIDEKRAEIHAEQIKAARAVIAGKVTPEVALQRLGAFVVGLVQARIAAGIAPPLAASTLRRKGRKSTPLILTGQLRSAITYAVQGAA